MISFRIKIFSVVFFFIGTFSGAQAAEVPLQITYFGNNLYPPAGIEDLKAHASTSVTVYNLDDHRNLEKELAAGLPKKDLELAKRMAKQRVASIPKERFEALFVGPSTARRWMIEKYPAVVFGNGEAVVYGTQNIDNAYAIWEASKKRITVGGGN